jgi:PAS domain S-box-containing protein
MENVILLVDDERDICEVLDISLSDLGYQVHTAQDGERALQIFRDINPPIVLTDIRMPGIDGIELLRTIKKESPDTEVIMLTGHGDMDLAIESLKLEATDFITKPINDDILGIALKRAHERITLKEKIEAHTENLERLVREQSDRLIKAERLAAVGQVVDGLASAMKGIVADFGEGITYFNELPCLVSIHNRELEIVATNHLYKTRLGDRIGCKSWEVYGNGAEGAGACPVARTFDTGKGQRSKEKIRDRSGQELPVIVHTAPIRNKEQDVELVLEISADVGEVNRLQEELLTTQQRYEQLFDEVPCYISVQDKEFRLVATNRRFKEDFGDDIGSYCYEIYKHRDTPCPECPVAKTFEEEESQQYETVVTSKTGAHHNVLIWTAPIRNAAGDVTHVMEMSTDITQIRKLQDRLTSLGLLLGSISHGIKGLLTGFDAGLYWLDTGLEKGNKARIAKGQDALTRMFGQMQHLVLNLLYYAKERELNWERTDVLRFAGDVARSFEPKIRGQRIEFVRDFNGDMGEFEVDGGVFSSALINILENAMEACTEDKSKEAHRITFGMRPTEGHILFEVSDDGVGMGRETQENMFTLFFSSKGSKGTGLGLFVSHEIIQQHGGTIKVDSTRGQGTRFRISMPKILPETIKKRQRDQETPA